MDRTLNSKGLKNISQQAVRTPGNGERLQEAECAAGLVYALRNSPSQSAYGVAFYPLTFPYGYFLPPHPSCCSLWSLGWPLSQPRLFSLTPGLAFLCAVLYSLFYLAWHALPTTAHRLPSNGELFSAEESQLTNVEGTVELGKHHFSTLSMSADSDKDHQGTKPRPGGKDMHVFSEYYPIDDLLIREKKCFHGRESRWPPPESGDSTSPQQWANLTLPMYSACHKSFIWIWSRVNTKPNPARELYTTAELPWTLRRITMETKQQRAGEMAHYCFSNFSVFTDHLGNLLKCRFWFSGSRMGPEILPS